jgi:hypothetical protein
MTLRRRSRERKRREGGRRSQDASNKRRGHRESETPGRKGS